MKSKWYVVHCGELVDEFYSAPKLSDALNMARAYKAAAPAYHNEGCNLNAVYDSYSRSKAAAWEYVKRLCENVHGTGLAVRSHNTFTFTANFYFFNPDNGRGMSAIITPAHNHAHYV